MPADVHNSSTDIRATTGQGRSILGRYRVIDAHMGGFGTVLTCWDTRLQRRVAIKQIPLATNQTHHFNSGDANVAKAAGLGGAVSERGVNGHSINNKRNRVSNVSTMAAALTEARTASLIAHPGIVTVFDFESDESFAYLVMEYVDGLNLAELLQRVEGGTLTGDEAAYVCHSVADALAYAHANGVLHLDIKPTNVIIDAAGTVKLCDFGMATLASAAGYGGARGGTVGYMPPEQILGDMVDERSDVFSLAVVTWQMLTGTNPFAAATADASLELIRRGPTRTLSSLLPNVDSDIADVMAAALSPDPSGRTASAQEFAQRAGSLLGDTQAGARSITHLLEQAVRDDGETGADEEVLPLAFRYPWLPGAITRSAAALTTAAAVAAPIAALLVNRPALFSVLAIISAAATAALWTPSGSIISVLTLVAALGRATENATAIMIAGVTALLAALWWVFIARRDRHASTALLAPIALRAPVAAAPIAGCYLPPLRAAITAGGAWILAQLHAASVSSGFDVTAATQALSSRMPTVAASTAIVGVMTAAALIAAITRHARSHNGVVAAQIVGALLIIITQLSASTMENADYVVRPTWSSVGVAVVLCVIMSIVTAICDATADEEEA